MHTIHFVLHELRFIIEKKVEVCYWIHWSSYSLKCTKTSINRIKWVHHRKHYCVETKTCLYPVPCTKSKTMSNLHHIRWHQRESSCNEIICNVFSLRFICTDDLWDLQWLAVIAYSVLLIVEVRIIWYHWNSGSDVYSTKKAKKL